MMRWVSLSLRLSGLVATFTSILHLLNTMTIPWKCARSRHIYLSGVVPSTVSLETVLLSFHLVTQFTSVNRSETGLESSITYFRGSDMENKFYVATFISS
jgi:hypothetical protein